MVKWSVCFYSNDPSSNLAEVFSFYSVNCWKRTKINKKGPGNVQFKKLMNLVGKWIHDHKILKASDKVQTLPLEKKKRQGHSGLNNKKLIFKTKFLSFLTPTSQWVSQWLNESPSLLCNINLKVLATLSSHCDQICRNFATWENFWKSFGQFIDSFLVNGKIGPSLEMFYVIGYIFICCKWQNIEKLSSQPVTLVPSFLPSFLPI